jgi:glutamate synthase domain-containing protein 2
VIKTSLHSSVSIVTEADVTLTTQNAQQFEVSIASSAMEYGAISQNILV